nr:glycosyltransferase family 4 protein [Natronocella acetinitrilica]
MFLLALVFAFSAGLTLVLRRYALQRNLMDVPNARSSHSVPTPRGGGVAIVVASLLAIALLGAIGVLPAYVAIGLALSSLMVAAVGYVDDLRHVAARWRLMVHLGAGLLLVAFVGSLPPVPFFSGEIALGWLALPLVVLSLGWLLNLYNFMDGIDGIAAAEAVTVCLAMTLLLWAWDEIELAVAVAALGAASLGFLVWNWPPARIFMGDAGSGFVGFTFGALVVVSWADAAFPIWPWLIMLGVFIVDASITLARRVLRGERFYEAHRSHAYQHASRRFGAHRPVTLAVIAINLLWLLPLAWMAVGNPGLGPLFLAIAWAPLVVVALLFHAGLPEPAHSDRTESQPGKQ